MKKRFIITGKTRSSVLDLSFHEDNKSSFAITNPIGKIIPLSLEIKDEESLYDFNTLLNYKKNLH